MDPTTLRLEVFEQGHPDKWGSKSYRVRRKRFERYQMNFLRTPEQAIEADARMQKFLASGDIEAKMWDYDCACKLKKQPCKKDWGRHWSYKHGRHMFCKQCANIPYLDHLRTFRDKTTGERIITHHPYYDYGGRWVSIYQSATVEAITKASQEWAEAHGLTVRVSETESWHAPGLTLFVEYRAAKKGQR